MGIPNEDSGSSTSKEITAIFRNEEKTRMKIWPTPTHKTSSKDQWYKKGLLGRSPNKSMLHTREFRQGAKYRMLNPHKYPRIYKEGIQNIGEKKHKFEEKEESPSSGINRLIQMEKKRHGQMIRYIGQRSLEDKQF